MRIFLSGPMGSGKSTVARVVAARSGVTCLDLDQLIEQKVGRSISEIFERDGESRFRAYERETLLETMAKHASCVIALGGGAVTDKALRRNLLGAGVLVTLSASVAELTRRVEGGATRPLLKGTDVGERITTLLEARRDAYAESHATIVTDARTPDAIATDVLDVVARHPIVVPLGARTYRVEIGAGVRARAAALIPPNGVVLLVSDRMVAPHWAVPLARSLEAAGRRVVEVTLEAGESAKHLESVRTIWEAGLGAGVDRGSVVLGVGGGVVGDLTGFAAATLLRGIAVGHLPTTLLAMVDSAIGGKTGFDTAHGKNLIGAIHQPSFVLSDVETLGTLPIEERRAGLAEVVKSAWLDSEAAVAQLEHDADGLVAGDVDASTRAIRMAAGLKARVVGEDEHENGLRATLNLGHTVGHAIEAAQGYTGMRHGEAVSLGMVAAARLGERMGGLSRAHAERIVALLGRMGLPVNVDAYLNEHTFSFLGSDKKRRGGKLTFVVPCAPGETKLVPLALAEIRQMVSA